MTRPEAKAFALWRAADSVGWDCTITEAALEAGIGISTAQQIARRRGWTNKFSKEALALSRNNSGRNVNLTDVCKLMGVR